MPSGESVHALNEKVLSMTKNDRFFYFRVLPVLFTVFVLISIVIITILAETGTVHHRVHSPLNLFRGETAIQALVAEHVAEHKREKADDAHKAIKR